MLCRIAILETPSTGLTGHPLISTPQLVGTMTERKQVRHHESLQERFRNCPRGKKIILVIFLIWLAQALPKWTAAIAADGELSARIMKMFVTPR